LSGFLLSNDLKDVLAVARNEKEPMDAKEIIKDPMILEFLGLKREASYYEKDLEQAIIRHLQDFLLELLCKTLHNSSYAYRFIM
jgi:predicted nuclease of restriction endonuclease-like (RecB) superfamily